MKASSNSKGINLSLYKITGISLLLFSLMACNLLRLLGAGKLPKQEVSAFVDHNGGIIEAPENVIIDIPAGAFGEATNVNVTIGGSNPIEPAGVGVNFVSFPIHVELSPDHQPEEVISIRIPISSQQHSKSDNLTALRYDGENWTDVGGTVEEDTYVITSKGFSTFILAEVTWEKRPVSFVNEGPFDAIVMPWTYIPLHTDLPSLPPDLAAASFAPGGPGLWPNPSRFLGLPLGKYTFCVEWKEDKDRDGDGFDDAFHTFLEGPSANLPLIVDENDSREHTFAEEVRFGTDVVNPLPGTCEEEIPAPASQWNVRLYDIQYSDLRKKPKTIAYAQFESTKPPNNVSFDIVEYYWKSSDQQTIALYNTGDWISLTCEDNDTTTVGVKFSGDDNDGWAKVYVDSVEVWRGSVYGNVEAGAMFRKYLEISGLPEGSHNITVSAVGVEGEGGGFHVAVNSFTCSDKPINPP